MRKIPNVGDLIAFAGGVGVVLACQTSSVYPRVTAFMLYYWAADPIHTAALPNQTKISKFDWDERRGDRIVQTAR